MHPQLTLAFENAPSRSFDTFHAAPDDTLATRSIEAFANGTLAERQIYLWGESGAGKSHLLSAACRTVSAAGYRSAYLPGELASQPTALDGLETLDLVCVDDLQTLDEVAETELAGCIDRCRESSTRLLFAADRPIEQLGLRQRDLATRLNWGPVFRLEPLSDEALVTVVRAEFAQRSLQTGDDVPGWLIRRFPRDMVSIKRVIGALHTTAIAEQKRITVPFVKRVVEREAASAAAPDGGLPGSG